MIFFDTYAYNNKLKASPVEKCIFAIFTMGICLASKSITVPALVILMMSAITIAKARVPAGYYIKMLLLPLSFLLISVCTILITFVDGRENILISFYIFDYLLGITAEGIETAFNLIFKSLGAVCCLYFLTVTTPMIQIMSVLRKIKCPSIIVELMGLIYKLIFVLIETAERIYISQDARLGYRSIKRGYHSLAQLASTLFVRSLYRSNALYISLEARGYDGELMVLEEKYHYYFHNILAIIIIDGGLVLLLFVL